MEILEGEVLDIHNEYSSYGEYKAALDGELQKSAESFVRIGYLLKVARDTDILMESGYRSVNEFAEKEYDLDKSQVSRFIRINDKFSENSYSDRLQERYRDFGYAKLAMMLLLPAEINEELTSSYSKAEIQNIRDEYEEEKRVSDLEVMMEEKDERQQACGIFGKMLYQIGKDNPEMYLGIYDAVCNAVPAVEKLMDVMAPSGEAIISARVPGEGRKMLSIKGTEIDPVVVDVRSGEKVSYTWDDLISEVEALCSDAEDARKAWEILYKEPFPEKKAEVAPVQPKKEQGAQKTSKVTKAKNPEKTREETKPEESETMMPAAGQQEQEMEEQEAAGVESEESGKDEAQGEDCAVSEAAGESSTESEHADEENGAAGGAGEGSSCGGEDGEGQDGDVKKIRENELKVRMGVVVSSIDVDIKENDWQAVIYNAREIINLAEKMMELEDRV